MQKQAVKHDPCQPTHTSRVPAAGALLCEPERLVVPAFDA